MRRRKSSDLAQENPPPRKVCSPSSNHSSQLPAILAAFRTISATDVYTMAPKESVVRGYEYYRQQRLQHYFWSQDFSALTAQVQGTRLYSVVFSLHDKLLDASCDCPAWNPDRLCKHVLCACFTTKHILSPETFTLPARQDTRLSLLKTELFDDIAAPVGKPDISFSASVCDESPRKEPIYEIVIDVRHPLPRLQIHQNGLPLSRGWIPALPSELIPLLNAFWYSGFGEDPLLRYLRQHDKPFPILLATTKASIPLQWKGSVACRSKTEIGLVGDRIRVRAVCLVGGIPLARIVRFRNFVVDVDGGRLLYLKDHGGWTSFNSLRQRLKDVHPLQDPSDDLGEGSYPTPRSNSPTYEHGRDVEQDTEFSIPLDEFQSTQLDVRHKKADRILQDLSLSVEGRETPVHRPTGLSEGNTCSYALILKPPSNDQGYAPTCWRLQVQCRRSDLRFAPSIAAFGFISTLEQGRAVSGALRAQKRKTVLYDLFFSSLSIRDPKEQERQIKTAISLEGWPRAVSEEAARWLKQSLAGYARSDLRLQIRAGRWELQPVEKDRESLLYHIPYTIFGSEIFRGMRRFDEMTIDSPQLFQRLPNLLETLAAAGIDLLYQDKPLRSSRWDCSIHVGRSEREGTGIDWFEIRPEIWCDGMAVDEGEWRSALRQGGLIQGKDGLRVLDSQTVERLRAILDLTGVVEADRTATQIVRVPRLQILDWLALREQGIAVSLPAEDEAVLARLLRFSRIAAPPLPKGLRATLRPYQRDGYAWLAFLYEHRFGACLADDMGLGKTLQAICLLAAVREGRIRTPSGANGPHLVVVPTSLLFNWEQELGRFAPDLKVHIYSGNERTLDAKNGEVVLATYGVVRRDIEILEGMAFHIIIFDEAQAVKNILADTTAAVRRLKGRFKLTLTGTPLENHLGEYFSVIDLCVPGLLGEHDRFKTQLKRGDGRTLERMLRRTRPFILRRTKTEILHDLPPKIESEVFLDLTDRQKALYRQTVAQVRSTIDEAYRTKTSGQAQLIALTAILKLRQVCLSPRLLTNRDDEPSPKLRFLMERLSVLLEEGHSALVFSQFTGFLDLVEESCSGHQLPYHRLDGSTEATARKGLVAAFQTGDRPSVFLLSLKAGGQGLNLTKASYVFHLDPWWNPAVESQASDRAHRIGQQRTVSIVRILMRHSIEEKMMALKQRKLELYEAVMSGAVRGSGQSLLTKTDFEFLLSPSAQ